MTTPAENATESIAVLGVLSRVDARLRNECVQTLNCFEGVSTFEVDDLQRIGVLIERDTLDDAEATLRERVEAAPGVLGAWPVFVHAEGDPREREFLRAIEAP